MKQNLPYLTQDRLNLIFEGVYGFDDISSVKVEHEEQRIIDLVKVLYGLQQFNHFHRWDDTRHVFNLMEGVFEFNRNSEGTTLWLALILAIQELYGFTDDKIRELMHEVTIRK
jgi:hypothetical protein